MQQCALSKNQSGLLENQYEYPVPIFWITLTGVNKTVDVDLISVSFW